MKIDWYNYLLNGLQAEETVINIQCSIETEEELNLLDISEMMFITTLNNIEQWFI